MQRSAGVQSQLMLPQLDGWVAPVGASHRTSTDATVLRNVLVERLNTIS